MPQSKPPKSKYIVVEDPWPGHDNSRALRPSQAFFNYVGAWLHIALGCAEPYPVKAIYHRSKRDEIVVKLDKRVDITPLLGAHHWRKFTTYQSATSNDTISYIFEFNYKRHGDPAENQWTEVEPVPPPPNRKLPIREPDMYPAPSRTSLIGRASIDLALKLPEERLRAETPPPPEPVVEPPSRLEIKRDSDESRDIKRPFDAAGILSLPAHPSVKMDPYDAERMHAHVLQSQNARSSSRLPESVVKVESHENESQSQPPAALLQALEKLQQARMKTSRRKEGADAQSEAIEEALRRLHESREPQEGQASDPGLPRMSTTLSEQADELRTAIEELKRATIPSGQPASSNPMSFVLPGSQLKMESEDDKSWFKSQVTTHRTPVVKAEPLGLNIPPASASATTKSEPLDTGLPLSLQNSHHHRYRGYPMKTEPRSAGLPPRPMTGPLVQQDWTTATRDPRLMSRVLVVAATKRASGDNEGNNPEKRSRR